MIAGTGGEVGLGMALFDQVSDLLHRAAKARPRAIAVMVGQRKYLVNFVQELVLHGRSGPILGLGTRIVGRRMAIVQDDKQRRADGDRRDNDCEHEERPCDPQSYRGQCKDDAQPGQDN